MGPEPVYPVTGLLGSIAQSRLDVKHLPRKFPSYIWIFSGQILELLLDKATALCYLVSILGSVSHGGGADDVTQLPLRVGKQFGTLGVHCTPDVVID